MSKKTGQTKEYKEKLAKAVVLFKNGETPPAIAKKLCMDVGTLRDNLREYGYIDLNIDTGLKKNLFTPISSREAAYWFGLILADGCVNSNRGFEITLKEKYAIEGLKKFLNTRCIVQNKKVKYNGEYRTYYRLSIRNKEFEQNLMKAGFCFNKSFDLKYCKVPEEYKYDFARGYIDGNGCISKMRNAILLVINSTENFLSGFVEDFGLPNNKIRKVSGCYEYRVSGDKALEFLDKVYNDTTLYLTRKHDIYNFCRFGQK